MTDRLEFFQVNGLRPEHGTDSHIGHLHFSPGKKPHPVWNPFVAIQREDVYVIRWIGDEGRIVLHIRDNVLTAIGAGHLPDTALTGFCGAKLQELIENPLFPAGSRAGSSIIRCTANIPFDEDSGSAEEGVASFRVETHWRILDLSSLPLVPIRVDLKGFPVKVARPSRAESLAS